MSHPVASIGGMDTVAMVEDTMQEVESFLASLPPASSEAANIEIIQRLERTKRILAAAQAQATGAFVAQRQAAEADARVPTSLQLKGIEAEVGLARGESPYVGAALTHTATALCTRSEERRVGKECRSRSSTESETN